jgi:hypothetical protein
MAFPVVSASTPSNAAANTSHTVNLPAGIGAGDLLLAYVTCDGLASTIDWPAGWDVIKEAEAFNAQAGIDVAYRIADGGEGASIAITFGASLAMASRVLRITSWHGTTPPEVSTGTNMGGGTTVPDPDALTPSWGPEDTLWLASLCHDSNPTVSAYPSDYTDGEDVVNAATNGFALARRELNAASEDPGTFTIGATQECFAFTVAVRPAGGGPPPETPLAPGRTMIQVP